MSDYHGHFLYPRLDPNVAMSILSESSAMTLLELFRNGRIEHPMAAPSPSGGRPVNSELLRHLQDGIREIATSCGYPSDLAKSHINKQNFDNQCGDFLYNEMAIVPADAADVGVWSFLSLVVVPEIGPWRFSNRTDVRLLGHPRNVLRRLWWRAWAFGGDLNIAPTGCTPLGEDESVAIMERPSLGGNQRTARALRDSLWRAELEGVSVARSELMRQLARRLRAERSHIALDALSDSQLVYLLDGLVSRSLDSLCEGSGEDSHLRSRDSVATSS